MGKKIEDFLNQYTSKSTIDTYRSLLNQFFKTIGAIDDHYFYKKRNYEEDIKKFFIAIKDKPPKTVRLSLSTVKVFLSENNIDLPEKFWRRLRRKIKGNRALILDKVPSNEELRSVLAHMDAKGKALFLTLASSGMRIGETLQLQLSDVELDNKPPKIKISGKYTKAGNSRIAFISTEAKIALEEWLKERKSYLKCAVGRSHKYEKPADDNSIFPFQINTAEFIWRNAIKKAGLGKRDENTNRHTLHPHVLRKFFRSKMGTIIPVDIVEALMGHEGYLTEVYRKYSEDKLAEFYLKGESSLTVFADRNGIKKLRKEIQVKNEAYDEIINRQASEIKELKEELAKLEQSKEKQLGDELIKALEKHPDMAKKLTEMLIRKAVEENPEMLKES